MQTTPAVTQLGAVLGPVTPGRAEHAERLLVLLPSLAEENLLSADLALGRRPGVVAVRARILDPALAPRVAQRLAFWFGRSGGWCQPIEKLSAAQSKEFLDAFDDRERSFHEVRATAWPSAVRHIFAAINAAGPEVTELMPELRLHVGGTGWDGFTFDALGCLLGVPSPLAPCPGDVIQVVLECPERRRIVTRGTVVTVRGPSRATSVAPAGFTLALAGLTAEAAGLLEKACPSADERYTRRAPRYAVFARAALNDPEEELRYGTSDEFLHDYVTNLSHGGAFVRTTRPRKIGDPVALRIELPDGRVIASSGIVVHRTDEGVGLQLELTPDLDASLSAIVAGLSARPRRVLVVDDDPFVRGMLVDAFELRGFEAISAPDGVAGLRAITEELFSLDAVVTDLHMPGLSGEALVSAVRTAGGESELVLVIVSASVDPDLTTRLIGAGANRVVSKDAGASRVVAEVESALAQRANSPPSSTTSATVESPASGSSPDGDRLAREKEPEPPKRDRVEVMSAG